MSSAKPIAIVLGGTNPHVELVKNLRNRGYHVILLDYLENPPAEAHADAHEQISTLDKDAVLKYANKMNAALIISTCIDHANATACYVAEKLNLPSPYSYSTAVEVTNKVLMKEKMKSAGIPTSDFVITSQSEQLSALDHLNYPLIVKPADSTGSAGVRTCKDRNDLDVNLQAALKISRNGNAIVEEFIEGIEISADFAVESGIARPLLIRRKFFMNKECGWVMQSPGNIAPAVFAPAVIQQINDAGQMIAKAFSIRNSPLLVQGIVKGDTFNVIEFAPRIGGGMSYKTVELLTGFRLLDYSIDSYFGGCEITKSKPQHDYLATLILYAKPGTFTAVQGVDALLESQTIEGFYPYKTIGTEISPDMSTKSRIGAMTISGSKVDEIISKVKSVAGQINIIGKNGENLTRSSVFDDVIKELITTKTHDN